MKVKRDKERSGKGREFTKKYILETNEQIVGDTEVDFWKLGKAQEEVGNTGMKNDQDLI